MTDKDTPWFLRRHDYRPEAIGLTTPQPSQSQPTNTYVVPAPGALPPASGAVQTGAISIQLDHISKLLEELLRIQAMSKITEFDIDISDSVSYSLDSNEAAIISYSVPSNYVMLLREFFTSLKDSTTYYVYLNDEVFQYSSDMTFPDVGIAISSQVEFKIYVLNTHTSAQSYSTTLSASLRREAHWDYPTYSYKKPV